MLLGQILRPGLITTTLKARNKFEAIEELMDLLVSGNGVPEGLREHLVEMILARERSTSTGMERGVAMPHGISDQVAEVAGALGIAPMGVPFESLDGLPAKLIILLVLPKENLQAHVRTLAGIAYLMGNATFCESLVNARDEQAALSLIRDEEKKEPFEQYRD